jgi:hypothetical protein
MARAGRKRKSSADREPNGRARRTYVNPQQQVMDQPHRIVVPVRFRDFQEAGSEFGRLVLLGHITPAQHEAGKLYAELAAKYRSALMAPSPSPAAMDLERVGRGRGEGMADEVARTIRDRYNRAFEACGVRRVQLAVRDHAVFEKEVPDLHTLNLLRCGLDDLTKHFGVDRHLQISTSQK